MKSRQYDASLRRNPRLRCFVFTLAMLLALPLLGFVRRHSSASAQNVSGGSASPAFGLLFTVNSTADTADAVVGNGTCSDSTGKCTLRAAIQEANANSTDDTIDFNIPTSDPGYNGSSWIINLNPALPNISKNLIINGPGPAKNTVTVKRVSTTGFSIFTVTSAAKVSLSNLMTTNGSIGGSGGGISNLGTDTVSLTNCDISGNSATTNGGGISNGSSGTVSITDCDIYSNGATNFGGGISNDSTGTITITNTFLGNNSAFSGGGVNNNSTGTVNVLNSYLTNNTAEVTVGRGGGISNYSGGVVKVTGSTLSLNHAADGGGISNGTGSVSVTNSTISSNVVSDSGGGVENSNTGAVIVSNSTISSNTREGLANNGSGNFFVKSSIVALNTGGSNRDVFGSFISGGFNLIGKTDGSTGFSTSDQTGLDPKLDPHGLTTNGGSTPTIALQCGSPAIDKGTSISYAGPLDTDQRGTGFLRKVDDTNIPNGSGDGTDVGAFEVQQACAAPTPSPSPQVSNVQFSTASYGVNEGAGFASIMVTRTGSTGGTVTVDYATSDVGARQRTDYTINAGTLTFAPGDTTKTFPVLIVDDVYVEGSESLNLTLSNPTGGAQLNSPSVATLAINDNDSASPTTNPLDDAHFFVRQHYYDFLSRYPDQSGWDFWTGQITQCGSDPACLRNQRIGVSNAFFYELEYQQTGSYVFRMYRAAFGNNQPSPNPDSSNQTEARKLPSYAVFAPDRARVVGGSSLAAGQQNIANSFVQRPEFLTRYPAAQDGPTFVDAILATIHNDTGVDLNSQRNGLINLFNAGGRGAVLYRLADDNTQTNPINNRSFIDEEYNRAFVATEYFGYLRRNADMGGFLFWLGQVNSAPLRDLTKQHAMVCSFITSTEYQQRLSSVVSHSNAECGQ